MIEVFANRRAAMLFFLWLVCVPGCKTDEEHYIDTGCRKLTATEVKKLYNGNAMRGVLVPWSINAGFHVYYYPNGIMVAKFITQKGNYNDMGSYSILDDGSLCCVWRLSQNDLNCDHVYKCGDHYKVFRSTGGELLIIQRMASDNLKELKLIMEP